MIYTALNSGRRAIVYDVDTLEKLEKVLSIDTDTGVVLSCVQPVQVNPDGELACVEVQFRSIYPICGGAKSPVLFHCYGRVSA